MFIPVWLLLLLGFLLLCAASPSTGDPGATVLGDGDVSDADWDKDISDYDALYPESTILLDYDE